MLTCELAATHGWANYSLNLSLALQRLGVPLTIVSPRNSPDVPGLEQHRLLPNTAPRDQFLVGRMALASPAVRQVLRGCDLVHVTVEPYVLAADWAAGSLPLVVTGHGSYMGLSQRRGWPLNALYRRAFERAHIVCVSHYTEKVVHAALPGVKTSVVNNGVDVARFAAPRIPTSPPTILSVGALKPRKGTLELVRAMAQVHQHRPEVQCIIIGSLTQELAYVERVRQTIHELGLQDTVHLLGHVPDATLLEWYHKADLFVLPSINDGWKFEGYGIVYLEASAAGLPVIGTTDCGAEDAIDDGLTGLLVSQVQVAEALPPAILRLLDDRELAAKMGEAGRAKAERQNWDAVAGRMLALYNEVGGS